MSEEHIIYIAGGASLVDAVTQGTPYSAHEVWELARMARFNERLLRTALTAGCGNAYDARQWIIRHRIKAHNGT